MFGVWIISVVTTAVVAGYKNRNVLGWFFLGLILGPLALIAVIISPKIEESQKGADTYYSGGSLGVIKAELENLKAEFNSLSNRLNNVWEKVNALEPKAALQEAPKTEIPAAKPQESQAAHSVIENLSGLLHRKTDMEMNLGKFWLNKIGIIIFSIGVAFLLNYTFARFGPIAKILFGYFTAAALFILGIKLEQNAKFINYGRVLLGGSWAIAYFTTYAMYHFEAAKIINSQLLGLLLLAVVASGIIAHSLRYKSEALTAVALFIGYFTSALGDVGNFTLISAALLAIVTLIIVYKMQWVRFIFLGITLTYLTHFAWVIKQIIFSRIPVGSLNVENVCFIFDAGFLFIYWLLFTLAAHLMRDKTAEPIYKRLGAANFFNFILFFFMVYPKFYYFYPGLKFNAVIGLGIAYIVLAAIMEFVKRKELFISDIVIAVSLLTLAVPLKFLPYHTTAIWLIELPFLLFVSFIFERRVYRYLGFALSVILFFKLMFMGWQSFESLRIFSITVSWHEFLFFTGFVSMSVCYWFYRFFQSKKGVLTYDKILQNFYSGFSAIYLTVYLWDYVRPLWLTLGLSIESLLIFAVGALLLDKYIRWYALAILALVGMRFCFYHKYPNVSELQQLFLVYGPVVCAFGEYFIYRKLNKKSLIPEPEIYAHKILFFAAVSLFIFATVVHVQQIWITLSIAIVAILSLLWGVKISDKCVRIYSLLILIFVAVRFSFIDNYYGLSKIFQWLLILAKVACAYTAYFIYRGLNKKTQLDESEQSLINPIFYASSLLAVLAIFKYVLDIWVAVALGTAGVVLFTAGFLIKDKVFRHGGFIIFAITLARVVIVDLSGLAMIYKIISFIVIGVLFLGVSFIYTKYMVEKK